MKGLAAAKRSVTNLAQLRLWFAVKFDTEDNDVKAALTLIRGAEAHLNDYLKRQKEDK